MPPAPAGEDAHDLGDEDLPPFGHRTEPRRLDERQPMRVGGLPGDVPRANPDPDAGARHIGPAGGRVDRLLDRDRGGHRVGRAWERRHDPVAEVVVERAAMGGDGVGQEPMVGLPACLGAFLAELHAPGRRGHEVGEEDRGGAGGPLGGLGGHRSAVYFAGVRRGKDR
jgi:hypothetical protein